MVSVESKAWMNVFGYWTLADGLNVSGTAVFRKEVDFASMYSRIKTAVTSGYASGAWNRAGLRDSPAAMNSTETLGYARATTVAAIGQFNGVAVDAASTIVHHTLDGDLNLDNLVNFRDVLIIAQNYQQSGRDFSEGDVNFDGTVNFTDLLHVSQLYGGSLNVMSSIHRPDRIKLQKLFSVL